MSYKGAARWGSYVSEQVSWPGAEAIGKWQMWTKEMRGRRQRLRERGMRWHVAGGLEGR